MPILTKRTHYARVPTGKKNAGSNAAMNIVCGSTLKRVVLCTSIMCLVVFYSLNRRPNKTATLLRAVHINEKGEEKVYTREKGEKSDDKQFTGRDADQFAQQKVNGMMLLHPDIQQDVDDEILDDDAMADKDEELAEHDLDLREPSRSDIQHSGVWKSTLGKHSPPTNRGRSKRRRRRKRKPIPLPRKKSAPKPPKKPWESRSIALRIIVLTYNRANSLQRLLRSLRDAQYGKDERIDLDIWIDKPEGNKPHDKATRNVAENSGEWKYGRKRVHLRKENKGLAYQWIHSWKDSLDPGIEWNDGGVIQEKCVILEDVSAQVSFDCSPRCSCILVGKE